MGFREDLARRIEKKRAEIAELETQVLTARTYLQALEDTYKLAAKESGADRINGTSRPVPSFRFGSMTGAAYAAIKAAGRPMHINDLLRAIGRELSRQDRSAVTGTLAAYVRKGHFFTRPAPNTFGLAEFDEEPEIPIDDPVPPVGFGKL